MLPLLAKRERRGEPSSNDGLATLRDALCLDGVSAIDVRRGAKNIRKAPIKANLQSELLAAPWICQVLGINSLGVSHISVHLASRAINCPFVLDDLYKDVCIMNKALKDCDSVSLQSRGMCKKDNIFL